MSKNEKLKMFKYIFTKKRFPEDYTTSEDLIIKVATKPNPDEQGDPKFENRVLYGSNIFLGNIYSGDIDIMTKIPLYKQAQQVKNIINNIVYDKHKIEFGVDVFIGDIKMGFTKYKELKNYIGIYDFKKNELIGYDASSFRRLIKSFGLYDVEEKIFDNPTLEEWIKLYYEYHLLVTRRWTYEEVLIGYQVEEDGSHFTIEDAVTDTEITKIDIYSNGESFVLIECTNMLIDPKKYDKTIKEVDQNVFQSMLTCLYVKQDYLKALKRLYSLTRKRKQIDLALKLHAFVYDSNVATINYVRTLMNIGNYVIQNYHQKFKVSLGLDSYYKIALHYDYIQTELQRVFGEHEIIYKLLNEIDNNIQIPILNKENFTEERLSIINHFTEKTEELLTEHINNLSLKFISDNDIIFENFAHLI